MIDVRDLELSAVDRRADALLIRTGFYRLRHSDTPVYCGSNPFISSDAAGWIRKNLVNLNMIGVDAISISSKAHRSMGAESHKILLGDKGYGSDPVMIIEDLNISDDIKKIDELLVFPLFSAGIDSSPCTVIGVIYG
jgi:kynurenine formamidase